MSLPEPVTRKEQYLNEIATGEHTKPGYPVTREEMYLDAIAEGGGGGTTNYNNLENRPQVNGHTLEGDMSFEDLGIDETPTEDSTNAVASGGVYAGLADKIDKSSTGYQTITGNPLEFDSLSPQIVGMKCDIVATQDLHGYDKPWAGGSGKNLLPLVLSDIKALNTEGTWNDNKYTFRNCEIEFNTNGDFVTSIKFKNTSNEQFNLYLYQETLPEGSYVLNGCPANGSINTYWQSMAYGYGDVGDGVSFTSDGQTNFNLQIVVRININMDNKVFYPMVRLATETDPTFEPYSNICPIEGTDSIDIDVTGGETYTIDLDGTRYGGQLDVGSGVLTLTHGYVVLNKNDGWTLNTSASHSFICTKDLGMVEMWDSETRQNGISNCGICDGNTAYWGVGSAFAYSSAGNALYVANPNCTSLDDFKAFLDSVSYEICGKLATPQTVQLTPTQVWAVQGGNTITVSVDGVEAEINTSNYATFKDIEILYNMIKGG